MDSPRNRGKVIPDHRNISWPIPIGPNILLETMFI
jgi:hypothetical protein